MNRDISDRKQAEQALSQKNEELSIALQQLQATQVETGHLSYQKLPGSTRYTLLYRRIESNLDKFDSQCYSSCEQQGEARNSCCQSKISMMW